MKRFHIHLSVDNLAESVAFYNRLFAQEPSLIKDDYAKWVLDDPRISFVISTSEQTLGLNHFGVQADTEEELSILKQQSEAAMGYSMDTANAETCCYSLSKKYWVNDPSGIPWEHYTSLSSVKTFNQPDNASTACCTPSTPSKPNLKTHEKSHHCC